MKLPSSEQSHSLSSALLSCLPPHAANFDGLSLPASPRPNLHNTNNTSRHPPTPELSTNPEPRKT
ncbi:hypothetical protein LZ31DRAFT_548644 [Colletotrichum somersetense]|nr:hypothetical protein LZ31DRAFT_548644 [Colletotrichum somersetense]